MAENRGQILVIDDELGIREGCRRTLEREGYGVTTAGTSQEGLRLIYEKEFDLVLLDVLLPDIRGIDLLPSIRKKDPDIVCIIITGYATVELAVQTIKAGAYDFLSKPFTPDLLLMSVGQGLEKRRLSLQSKLLQAIEREKAEMARAKEELKQLNRFKTTFALTVAHELRAPVAAIQSFLLLLAKGYVPAEQQESIVRKAIERTQELLELVDDLLNLAAARQELTPDKPKVLSLGEVLEKVLPLWQAQAEAKGLTLTVGLHRRPFVKANLDQMGQLWANLISNAIKYTPPPGQVQVTLEEENEWAIGAVKDTGIGIATEDLPWIFDEFYRTAQAKQIEPRGTGLGLSLVKQIVEKHGGSLDVESTLGKGSCFTFRLPVAAPKSAPVPDPAHP
jgi:two-component system sensor histidine kinase/response regulator